MPVSSRGQLWAAGKLMQFLTMLGRDVSVTVKPATRATGQISVNIQAEAQ